MIDPREQLANTIGWYLTSQGLRVSTASDVVAAQVRASGYDCIVLGVAEALDAAKLTRVLREVTGTPIVVISSTRDTTAHVDALEAGADHFMFTPYSQRELLSRIQAIARRTKPHH